MIVTYAPEAGAAERCSTNDLTAIESAEVERVTGLEWLAVEDALRRQSPTAMRAVLWVWRKRQKPTLRFSDFDVPGWKRRLQVRLEADEVVEVLEHLRKVCDSAEELEQSLPDLERICDDPADLERALKDDGPKEPAGSPSGSTSIGL